MSLNMSGGILCMVSSKLEKFEHVQEVRPGLGTEWEGTRARPGVGAPFDL